MIRELLVIAGLLAAMGALYLVVRWGAGRWNRFLATQADKLDLSSGDRDPYGGRGPTDPSKPPPADDP